MSAGETILDQFGVDIGYKTEYTKIITEKDINLFAEASGDFNPVHMRQEYAEKTFFKGRIAHGILSFALLSAAGAKLPGLSVLLSITGRFVNPVRIGDRITATAEVIKAQKDKGIVTLKSTCINQNGTVVIDGEMTIRLFKPPADS